MSRARRPAAIGVALVALAAALLVPGTARGAADLTVTPITWNIVGLDSNSPTAGPYRFPVGARVCTTGAATTATVNFVWDDGLDPYTGNPYINLRPGSLSSISLAMPASGCADAYFEAQIAQVSGAYDQTRRSHITATDLSGTASTPQPRQLYVEHLISQNRNSITDVKLNGVSIPSGGTMTLVVGNTYTIELDGGTATQGYNQFEAFINFPNTIFQILAVNTSYSADTASTSPPCPYPCVPNPNDKLYADACGWENDPTNPNYDSCVGGDYKAGGNTVVTTYTVKIIGGGGTSQALNTLLFDFSGSSFHYNSDFSTGARIANILDPTTLTIAKSFSPNPTIVGGVSTLTFTITNPNSGAVSGASFSDSFPTSPGAMVVATPATYSTSGCGSPTFTPIAAAGSISFSGGTIAASGTCTVQVNVTTPTAGTYNNASNDLFAGTVDTGHSASASLVVNSTPPPPPPPTSCATPSQLAQWTFENYTASTSTNNGPFNASSAAAGITGTGTYGAGGTGGSESGIADPTTFPTGWKSAPDASGNTGNSWGISGGWPDSGTPSGTTVPYFQFEAAGASAYGGVASRRAITCRGTGRRAGTGTSSSRPTERPGRRSRPPPGTRRAGGRSTP